MENGANINQQDQNHETPLHLASWKGNSRVVEFLLKNGAKRELKNLDEQTALDLAMKYSKIDVIRVFDKKINETSD